MFFFLQRGDMSVNFMPMIMLYPNIKFKAAFVEGGSAISGFINSLIYMLFVTQCVYASRFINGRKDRFGRDAGIGSQYTVSMGAVSYNVTAEFFQLLDPHRFDDLITFFENLLPDSMH